jgi:hypothetical protein
MTSSERKIQEAVDRLAKLTELEALVFKFVRDVRNLQTRGISYQVARHEKLTTDEI